MEMTLPEETRKLISNMADGEIITISILGREFTILPTKSFKACYIETVVGKIKGEIMK